MTESIHLSKLKVALVSISILIPFLVSPQWVKKADGLKPRSELGETIVYNSKIYNFVGFSDSLRHAEPTSEVYDPVKNTWSYIASMPPNTAMTHQDVILVDNTIWLIGGRVGQNPGPMSSVIWIYNITTNTWSTGPEIRDPATGKTMVIAAGGSALLGRVLHIFGGFTPTACNNDQDKYHLTLDVDRWLSNPSLPAQWENKLKPIPMKRNHLSSVVLGGKIYAIGGQLGHDCGGGKEVSYCHVYNPTTDSWTQLTSLPTGRSHAEGATFAIDGKIYMVGGQGSDGVATKKVTVFDPADNNGAGTWTENTSLALPYIYEGLSARIIGSAFIISHGSRTSSKYPQKVTYSRPIIRNPVYKLGFPSECLYLNDSSGSIAKGHTWLYTIDSTKNYTTSSSADWLTVSKNASGTANPNAVDIEVTANATGLNPGTYTATITATGTGGGTNYTAATLCINLTIQQKNQPSNYNLVVTSNGTGSVSKSPDQATYVNGSNVILTAIPGEGQQFAGWSGDVGGTTNPLTITMNADKAVSATFVQASQYNLAVSANGNGSVDINPNQTTYTSGSNVILTATPDGGQQFTGWSGSASGTANPLTITMDADKSIIATFAPVSQYSLSVSTNGSGTVAKSPDQAAYNSGTSVTLTAAPDANQQFTGWSGDATGSVNPLNIGMNTDKVITANFSPTPSFTISNIATTTGRAYTLSKLVVGVPVYTDRTYQATTVPAALNNAPFIKTANDDKFNASATLFSFEINQTATVYVAYDPRGTTLPSWLNTWQKVSQQIGVNDSKISYMVLYSKDYPAGKVTLGGNLQSPAKGALNNYFVVILAKPLQRPLNNVTTSIPQKPKNVISGFKIYPNPNPGDKIFIEDDNFLKQEMVTITIYDALGKNIQSRKILADNNGTFKTILINKSLNKGLYIIEAKSVSGSIQHSKLIIN